VFLSINGDFSKSSPVLACITLCIFAQVLAFSTVYTRIFSHRTIPGRRNLPCIYISFGYCQRYARMSVTT